MAKTKHSIDIIATLDDFHHISVLKHSAAEAFIRFVKPQKMHVLDLYFKMPRKMRVLDLFFKMPQKMRVLDLYFQVFPKKTWKLGNYGLRFFYENYGYPFLFQRI